MAVLIALSVAGAGAGFWLSNDLQKLGNATSSSKNLHFSLELRASIFQIAVAVGNCCFSALTSTIKVCSSVCVQPFFATWLCSGSYQYQAHKPVNHGMRERASSSKKGLPSLPPLSADKYQPEGEGVPNKFNRNGRGKYRQSQSVGYRGFGVQRKEQKESVVNQKEQQVESKSLQDADFLNAVVKVYCTHTAPDLTPPDCLRRMMPAPTADDLFTISTVGIVTKTLCASDPFEKVLQLATIVGFSEEEEAPNAGKLAAAIFVVFEVLRYFWIVNPDSDDEDHRDSRYFCTASLPIFSPILGLTVLCSSPDSPRPTPTPSHPHQKAYAAHNAYHSYDVVLFVARNVLVVGDRKFCEPLSQAQRDKRDDNSIVVHSISGRFPSVSLFKEHQNATMAILEKTDYTMISGHPFIKKVRVVSPQMDGRMRPA
ncbi:hypothetical protein FF2_000980 [Malus domestica]